MARIKPPPRGPVTDRSMQRSSLFSHSGATQPTFLFVPGRAGGNLTQICARIRCSNIGFLPASATPSTGSLRFDVQELDTWGALESAGDRAWKHCESGG